MSNFSRKNDAIDRNLSDERIACFGLIAFFTVLLLPIGAMIWRYCMFFVALLKRDSVWGIVSTLGLMAMFIWFFLLLCYQIKRQFRNLKKITEYEEEKDRNDAQSVKENHN